MKEKKPEPDWFFEQEEKPGWVFEQEEASRKREEAFREIRQVRERRLEDERKRLRQEEIRKRKHDEEPFFPVFYEWFPRPVAMVLSFFGYLVMGAGSLAILGFMLFVGWKLFTAVFNFVLAFVERWAF